MISASSCNIICSVCLFIGTSLLLPVTAVTEITQTNSQLEVVGSFILELWLSGSPLEAIIHVWIYIYCLFYLVFIQLNVLRLFLYQNQADSVSCIKFSVSNGWCYRRISLFWYVNEFHDKLDSVSFVIALVAFSNICLQNCNPQKSILPWWKFDQAILHQTVWLFSSVLLKCIVLSRLLVNFLFL